jgi:hypothetical protein
MNTKGSKKSKVFANPKVVVAFQKIFGHEHGGILLMSLLNAILDLSEDQVITNLTSISFLKAPHIPLIYREGFLETHVAAEATTRAGVTCTIDMHVKTPLALKTVQICQEAKQGNRSMFRCKLILRRCLYNRPINAVIFINIETACTTMCHFSLQKHKIPLSFEEFL